MTSAATAKIILFIAINLAPRSTPDTILATSSSDNYAWMKTGRGWLLETKGLPADEWEGRGVTLESQDGDVQAITSHSWTQHPILDLRDGSQVIKQRGSAFYIQHPGAADQKVFTILFSDPQ